MISGSLDVDGVTIRFRKPHLGPTDRFQTAALVVHEGDHSPAAIKAADAAAMALILDAVRRADPEATRESLREVLDEDSSLELLRAILRLSGLTEPVQGEAVSA